VLDAAQVQHDYHQWMYEAADQTWRGCTWHGVPIHQNPIDLFILQEIIWQVRPRVIVETGSLHGGQALFLAHQCWTLGQGRVCSVDNMPIPTRAQHPLLLYVDGDSVAPETITAVRACCGNGRLEPILVILDSAHDAAHVRKELDAYGPLVTPGSYLIVQDTNLNGHPVLPDFGPGPMEALNLWLAYHPEFEPDLRCERFGVSFHPGGWLRRAP
jgi:cephalosporin hydroxylase